MNRFAVVPAAGLVAVVLALVMLRGGGDDQTVSVYPNHRTLDAAAATAITFRGVETDALDDVSVTGTRSGRHSGRLRRKK